MDMDPELKTLLEQNHQLLTENNKILRTMRRYARIGIAFKILVWAVILGLPVLLWQLYFPAGGTQGMFDIVSDFESLQELLRTYEGVPGQ